MKARDRLSTFIKAYVNGGNVISSASMENDTRSPADYNPSMFTEDFIRKHIHKDLSKFNREVDYKQDLLREAPTRARQRASGRSNNIPANTLLSLTPKQMKKVDRYLQTREAQRALATGSVSIPNILTRAALVDFTGGHHRYYPRRHRDIIVSSLGDNRDTAGRHLVNHFTDISGRGKRYNFNTRVTNFDK